MSRAPRLAVAISVAILISSCGARVVEPAGDGFTPNSSATLETMSSPSVTTAPSSSTTTVDVVPAMAESEVAEIEAQVAEIERLAAELEALIDEPVTR